MNFLLRARNARLVVSSIAILFGMVTIFVGTQVFLGVDPGYSVFKPLLMYNLVMGFVYIFAGISVWRNLTRGRIMASFIFVLNAIILAIVIYLYSSSESIAVESVKAMTFRTLIWLCLWFWLWLLWRSSRRENT